MFTPTIGFIVFGILFALLIMSYILPEKKTKPIKHVQNKHVEPVVPQIGIVNSKNVSTTSKKLIQSTKQLNHLLRDKAREQQFVDDKLVLKGKMTAEEYDKKWNNLKAS